MRVLIVDRKERASSMHVLYSGILEEFPNGEIIYFDKEQIRNLSSTLKSIDFFKYDRVLFDIPVRRAAHAIKEIQKIPGLIYLELDACQDVMPESKYYNKFHKFFNKLQGAPVIVTSYHMERYLNSRGVAAKCILKAYDNELLYNMNGARDIELAFIGRVKSDVYRHRRKLLLKMHDELGLKLLRTQGPSEYLDKLNSISIFVSADIGFNEHMIKNFEAMACGCLLLVKRQPTEDDKVGFIHMVNVVQYNTEQEAINLAGELLKDPGKVMEIARAGQELVESKHKYSHRIPEFVDVIRAPYPKRQVSKSFFQKLFTIIKFK